MSLPFLLFVIQIQKIKVMLTFSFILSWKEKKSTHEGKQISKRWIIWRKKYFNPTTHA